MLSRDMHRRWYKFTKSRNLPRHSLFILHRYLLHYCCRYDDPIIPGGLEGPEFQSDLDRLSIGWSTVKSSVDVLYYEVAVGTTVRA